VEAPDQVVDLVDLVLGLETELAYTATETMLSRPPAVEERECEATGNLVKS